jgi:HD-GYP domain-containing protein (c-di-GMP phosphodiesterase class II)
MSSEPPGAVHSVEADEAKGELSGATLVEARGATLLDALERHLPGSRDHADGTASYAFAAAAQLGTGRARAEMLRETARLHEIGKVYLPRDLLTKPREELDPRERGLVDSHPAYGAELARGAGIPDEACDWIGAVGERFDGLGTGGLTGEQIPLEARIMRAACNCDQLLATRSGPGTPATYREAINPLRAAAADGELDSRVVNALAGIVERAARGSGYSA